MLTHFDATHQSIFDTSAADWEFAKRKNLTDRRQGIKLTHTRASAATYVAANGLVTQAAVNLVLWSESFDQSAWPKAACSINADQTLSPFGELTADKLVESNTNAEHLLYQARTGSNERITLSFYAKAAERTRIRIGFSNFATESLGAVYDLSNGTVVLTQPSGTDYTSPTSSIETIGDGWYRCVYTVTKNAVNTTNNPFVSPAIGTSGSYAGDGTSGIYVWGAQLETGSTATDYIKTTSTINSAPRFTHDPITGESLGLLVEEQKTNLLPRSEDFSATWVLQSTSVTTNSAASPDGNLTADLIQGLAGTAVKYTYNQIATTTSGVYTLSVFLKAGTEQYAVVRLNDQTGVNDSQVRVDLINGTLAAVTNNGTNTGGVATITRFGNGWYRVSLTTTFNAAVTILQSAIFLFAYASISTTTNFYIWGAQLETGGTPTSYIPTTTASATRLADNIYTYFGRTNLCLRSENFGATWTASGASVLTNTINDPLGALTADSLVDTAVNETHYFSQSLGSLVVGQSYTFSCYMKKGSKNYGYLLLSPNASWATGSGVTVFFDLVNGVVFGTPPTSVTASISDAGNGWYRCSVTSQCISTTSASVRVGSSLTGIAQTYTGAGDTAIYVWGAQFEVGQTATSYLATTSLAVTDYADTWFNPNNGCWIGDVYRESVVPAADFPIIAEATSPNRNSISQFSYLTSNLSGIYVTNLSTVQAELYPSVTALRRKVAFGYALDDFFTTANAGAFSIDTAGTPPTNVSVLAVGGITAGTAQNQLNGTIKRLTYFSRKLANATAWSLTK